MTKWCFEDFYNLLFRCTQHSVCSTTNSTIQITICIYLHHAQYSRAYATIHFAFHMHYSQYSGAYATIHFTFHMHYSQYSRANATLCFSDTLYAIFKSKCNTLLFRCTIRNIQEQMQHFAFQMHYTQYSTAYATIYLLVLMSLDRFIAVVFPVKASAYR